VVVANGSGAAVVGLLIGIILAAEAAGWGDGDGLAFDSDSGAGDDSTTSAPAVPTSVDGGATARPRTGSDDTVITVTDHFGRTVALAVPPAAGPDLAADVMQTLADHHLRAATCPDVADSRRHPLCDPTTPVVAIGLDGRQGVHSSADLGVTVDALSDEGFAVVRPSP
jgi:hypothetical protein